MDTSDTQQRTSSQRVASSCVWQHPLVEVVSGNLQLTMPLLSHHQLLCGTCKSLWLKFHHRDLQELRGANPTQTIPNPTSAFLPAGIQEYKWSPPSLGLSWEFTCGKFLNRKLHSPPGKSQTFYKDIPHSLHGDCTWVDTWVDSFQVSKASALIANVERSTNSPSITRLSVGNSPNLNVISKPRLAARPN